MNAERSIVATHGDLDCYFNAQADILCNVLVSAREGRQLTPADGANWVFGQAKAAHAAGNKLNLRRQWR